MRVGGECAQGRASARLPGDRGAGVEGGGGSGVCVCVCVCVCVRLGFITVLERLEVRPRVSGGRKLRGAFVCKGFS